MLSTLILEFKKLFLIKIIKIEINIIIIFNNYKVTKEITAFLIIYQTFN